MDLLRHQQRHVTSVSWPTDVDDKLNVLVRAAAAAGERTSRAEILAALITAVDIDPDELAAALHHYRRLPADALTGDTQRPDLPAVRSPGPQRTRHP